MDIKCWGSRGATPVSGPEYRKYGGDTTCIEITSKTGETIIVDAGTGLRRLGKSLIDRNLTKYYLENLPGSIPGIFLIKYWNSLFPRLP